MCSSDEAILSNFGTKIILVQKTFVYIYVCVCVLLIACVSVGRVGNVAVIESAYHGHGLIWWIIFLVLACSVCVLLIALAVTLTDGYFSTCKEYRHRMAKYEINGQMASAVANRLNCDAILDFMDYVEPFRRPFFRKDYVNYNRPHEETDYERGSPINTGVSLQIAITSAWINCVAWGAIIINYAVLIRSTGKCC